MPGVDPDGGRSPRQERLVVGCRGTNDEAMKEAVLLIGSIVVLVVIIPFVWGAVYAMGGE